MTIEKYIELNERFPLEEIRDSTASRRAIEIMAELVEREDELTIHEFAYLAALDDLIGEYTNKNEDPVSSLPGQEVLAHLLEEHSMSVSQLSDETGISEEVLEDFLAGESELVGSQIKALSEYFSLNPAAFLL